MDVSVASWYFVTMRYLIALLCAAALWANTNDTSPGIDFAKLPHPTLTKVANIAAFDGITTRISQTAAELQGKGWTVHLCPTCLEEVHRADLDGDGTIDYFITGSGPFGNTRTGPGYSITILLMDAAGLPVPFFAPVFQEAAKLQLVTLAGKTRLLVSRYDEIPSDARVGPYCSGHWVTQAYAFSKANVEEVRGVFDGMRFPFIRNWAYSHPECANHPIGLTERAHVPDPAPASTGKLLSKGLEVDTLTECATAFADAIVFESPAAGREIALPNLGDETQLRLADKIRLAGATVELRGVRDCTAALMWARLNQP